MDDREFLEFIAAQVGSFTDEISEIKKGLDEIKKSQQCLENVVTRMENSHGEKLDALFDGWKQNTGQLNKHNDKLEAIYSKLEKQELEITVIKGGNT